MIIQMRKSKNDGLLELIEKLPNNIIMGEVGCYAGESTKLFMKSNKIKKLYAIDPWQNGYDDTDPASNSNMELVEKKFNNNVENYNVEKLKMLFENSIDKLPPLDVIYIDGNHQYEAVLRDIKLSQKIVKPNGIISGHDYRKQNPIVRAVNEIFGKPLFIFSDTSWLVYNKI